MQFCGSAVEGYFETLSPINASEFVVFMRHALTSFCAGEFQKACAFSTLSNLIRTKRSGGVPTGLVNFALRMIYMPSVDLRSPTAAFALSITSVLKAVASLIFRIGKTT